MAKDLKEFNFKRNLDLVRYEALVELASKGSRWAMWELFNTYGEDGDGLITWVGHPPR